MSCTEVLGRLLSVAVFRLDDCMRPIYGIGAGFLDDCFGAFTSSDNMDEGESFTRRCANGRILYHDDGEQSLQSVTVELDLNSEPDIPWLIDVGLVQGVTNAGQDIGYTRCTSSRANLLIVLWQEVIGGDGCEDEAAGGGFRVHLYPLRNARLTFEGDLGAEDSYVRIAGNTAAKAELGRGPIPLLAGSVGGTNEVQSVAITGAPTGGTFTLSFGGQTTAPIAYNSAAAAVQTALRALSSIGATGVTVSGGPGPGAAYVVTFGGPLGGRNVPQMTASGSFTGGTSPQINVTTTTPGVPGTPTAIWPIDAIDTCHHTVLTAGVSGPPEGCGVLDTTPPA